ncbi:hypothetical protein IEQ34_001517 [Dendrobium chrysotoxum]|uniref:B-like cyclin n=1 Tax=Dendrobium chrysotoxum TaxID=161865 RepID=A0AAV7HNV7_DENCH|nr:hypothetical protein IEQ34_001517 [Dendrobium chrysotoxum]
MQSCASSASNHQLDTPPATNAEGFTLVSSDTAILFPNPPVTNAEGFTLVSSDTAILFPNPPVTNAEGFTLVSSDTAILFLNPLAEERPSLANFMDIQSDITSKMRSILVNWLIEVHHKYQLMEESLFLMIELLDRLLSIVNIKKNELQLFGLATLLLASKYEDYWHPKVDELISLSVNQYTRDEMLGMEIFILKKLKFRLNVPTPYVFMLRFLRAAQSDKKLEDLAFYLIELCLVENESLKFKPSLLCASAIFVARSNLKLNPPWTRLLSKHSHYEESQLRHFFISIMLRIFFLSSLLNLF